MLLVDDDQAEPVERREHRRARADDDVDLAAAHAVPLVVPLAVGEAAVLDGDAVAEAGPHAAGHRRRQGDLGHQHSACRPCWRTWSARCR